jgi:hypothetical protein
MPAEQIGVALLSLGVGLGVFRSIEPKLPVGALVNTLRVLTGLPVAQVGEHGTDAAMTRILDV